MRKSLKIGDYTVVFHNDIAPDMEDIKSQLRKIGVSDTMIAEADENLRHPNTGATFASVRKKKIIVLIGPQNDKSELLNTLGHEIRHVVDSLESAQLGISNADLTGEIMSHFADWL